MAESIDYETTDVVICGCGPTGALLSAYLSRMSVVHIVLEKETAITTDPRGIALDEDGIRLLQGVGLYDKIYTEIGTCMGQFQFIGGTQRSLRQKPFLQMDYSTTEGGTGHVGFICHKQPVLEKHLREAMHAPGVSALRSGCSVSHLSEDRDWMYCHYLDSQGNTHAIRSRFFVGADGKTGYTRKMYLEPQGVQMEATNHAFYDETWVALNWEITLPTPQSHPDFPLWSKGYTPEQVYDTFFPADFRFLCNPDRPAVCGRFGLPRDRLWRFEFVVHANEDGERMAENDMIMKVVFPYITHPGSLYGLTQDVQFPEDCIRVLRSRPFRFSARSCNRWAQGRVVLCGDAAHVFPPFGGQGIASGFRDAASLAWRLALLCRNQNHDRKDSPHSAAGADAPRHAAVLRGWYLERKQQLERSLASTIQNGRFVTESNPLAILLRSVLLFIQRLVPAWRRELRLGRRQGGMVRYAHEEGMPFLPEFGGGVCLPQGYCRAIPGIRGGAAISASGTSTSSGNGSTGKLQRAEEIEDREEKGEIRFTDDVIFGYSSSSSTTTATTTTTAASQPRLFRLLVYLRSLDDLPAAHRDIADIEQLSRGEIHAADVVFLVERAGASAGNAHSAAVPESEMQSALPATYWQVATGPQFAASSLCSNRPAPRFYDPYYMGKVLGGKRYVVLRPDRFVFAAVDSRGELQRALGAAADYLQGLSWDRRG
ncbi:3-(3-hydroxy-phenyl)propionate/3-hydroxycinnamic acid hydroxylase [Aspergillus udagawae]|nr:3-(3-hydroxy-phenyl)propionate/3-hydroxycinnamic acid hydroxylase [Aspergillus udagawae]